MMQMIFVTIALIALPLVLFFGIVGLAIFIWCWNRIGRYFINFGRWLGSWRNFIPLSILGILSLIFILVILPIIRIPSIVTGVLLIIFLLVTAIIFLFALIAWIVEFSRWFWPRWRRLVWGWFASIWGALPTQSGGGRRARPKPSPDRRPPADKQPARRPSLFSSFWALMLGQPLEPAKTSVPVEAAPAATVQPPKKKAPAKTSWFGSFWALMLGKPPRRTEPRSRPAKVSTTEQSLSPSGSATATTRTEVNISGPAPPTASRTDESTSAKRSWFGAFWSLMLGRPSGPTKPRSKPAKVQTIEQISGSPDSMAVAAKTRAATGTVKATTTPADEKREKLANRGFLANMWTSTVRGITFVFGLVFLGVVTMVEKIREGIEWIRIKLNLD